MEIAVFDSGIGGLTVLKEILKILPNEKYLYYSDGKNSPYGNKDKLIVEKLIDQSIGFIAKKNIKALVIACNTATSISAEKLRAKYNFPIIGMEPAIKPAIQSNKNKRILVFATDLTLKEPKFQNLVKQLDHKKVIDYLSLQELVLIAEKFQFKDEVIYPYLKSKLNIIDLNNYETVVLGCTHFPFFKKYFREIIPKSINIIDGNKGTALNLKNKITKFSNKINNEINYYISGEKTPKEYFEKYFKII